MASVDAIQATHRAWDDAFARILSLSSSTYKQNVELTNRVADLELEVALWKQAHSAALETAQRDSKAHNVQIATLNRQISSQSIFQTPQACPLIFCVINGDTNIFAPSFLARGQEGGRAVAQELTKRIAENLSGQDIHYFTRLSFWTILYVDKRNLLQTVTDRTICTSEQLDGFLLGFSQSSYRFSVVETTDSENAPRINEFLKTFLCLPQTLRVFFGAGRDLGRYASLISDLEREQLLGKVTLLRGSNDANVDDSLLVPTLTTDILIAEDASLVIKRPSPLAVSGTRYISNGGLISPQSPPKPAQGRLIDPTLPLHKQNPPPCNEHYLMTCTKGPGVCKYGHDYVLTQDQLASLAANAKKAPCNWLKNGVQCPFGDKCCWGHVCPNGPSCFHLGKGKCWFKGETMHPLLDHTSNFAAAGGPGPSA
ncbi:hypothetical protein BD626DRAFT_113332 [Schizophyllum amplum]|uniref:C3H1-type domain-containing protein n=1 Tax=Schizophyllum amplum TaxID=97359 RepID=A0A550CTX6_9AGAR|nr:hypothetical protein BD626DRAFT_113332 [Auriculariopsis ampla]